MAKHIRTTQKFDAAGNPVTETTEEVDETSPAKAVVGATITVAVSFLSALVIALDDNIISPVEWLTATVAALTSAGLVFGGVYVTSNKVKS